MSHQLLPDCSKLGFPRWTARSLVEQHQDPESHIDLKAHLPPGHLCPPVPLRGPQGGAEAPKGGAGREEAAAG